MQALVVIFIDFRPIDDLRLTIGKLHGLGRIDVHIFVVGDVIQHAAIRVFFLIDADLLVGLF